MTGYTDTIRRYALDDRFTGTLSDPDGVGEVGLGRDEAGGKLAVRFSLRLNGSLVDTVRFQVFGCGFTIAACAAAAELAEGRRLAELRNLTSLQIDRALGGLPAERDYCAALASEALRAAAASADTDHQPVQARLAPQTDHGPRLQPDDPAYRTLVESPCGSQVSTADRQLFAGVLALASREAAPLEQALNLSPELLERLLLWFFPRIDRPRLFDASQTKTAPPPEVNPALERLLRDFIPADSDDPQRFCSLALARILAVRAGHPGHLWVAMGLFERRQLSAAIGRHLPALKAANHQGMRWKRFLFRQLCERSGGALCKTPVCGDCSDYSLCFASED